MKQISVVIALLVLAGLISQPNFAMEINGAVVVNNNCSRCHNARAVHEFDIKEWSVILPHMREKAHLTSSETDAVQRFFQLVSSPSGKITTTPVGPSLSGMELMTKYGCQGCHRFNETGGVVGPSLDGIVLSKGEVFVRQKIRNPQFNNPTSAMPKMPMADAEIDAIVTLLKQPQP